jgi:hypothetical protein
METSAVAWYAAILATTVFTWDLAKWWRAEPRLRISANADALDVKDAESLDIGNEIVECEARNWPQRGTY